MPVFLADVKGDLSGISEPGTPAPKVQQRISALQLDPFGFSGFPVTFWDVFGAQGHPVRSTISEIGPLLLARLLQLNPTQAGVLNLVFRIADENGLLLLDLKDLRSILKHVGDNAAQLTTEYGNISAASVGAIQRNLPKSCGESWARSLAAVAAGVSPNLRRSGGRFDRTLSEW